MATPNPLPPGSNGLPLLGETLAFAKNPFAFIGQPAQDLSFKWVVPPEHRSGLVVRWSPKPK